MFDCGHKSQLIGGKREKFARLDDLDSSLPMASSTGGRKSGFNLRGLALSSNSKWNLSEPFRFGGKKWSEICMTLFQTVRFCVRESVFPKDLKVSDRVVFDPQDKSLQLWNKFFITSCLFALSVDPLFLYLPFFNYVSYCLGIHTELAAAATTLRTLVDLFYLFRMGFQFRTAYVAPSSRVFGRGELVIDLRQIAMRYLRRYFMIDLLSVLPLPQMAVRKFSRRSKMPEVFATKQALLYIVFLQYIPRLLRIVPLSSELKKTAGVVAETAWAGAVYYLLWYMLAGHMVGALWYLLAIERHSTCWKKACTPKNSCRVEFLYCGNRHAAGYDMWRPKRKPVLLNSCSASDKQTSFNYGIYTQAISSGILASRVFFTKLCYCLWWGLQNLSTLGQGLQTSTYPGENLFSIALAIFGLILFALLIGNMQTYLQSLTVRTEEMRIKRRDSEQWMHHRLLPRDLRQRVRRYDHYKWLETRGVDEENLVQNLPKDLQRDIKRHLCLKLVRRVPFFDNMDERLLDAICERLRPSLCTEDTYAVREGDPVDEMLFIIHGRLESITTDGGRSGFFNRGLLKEGDFCGDELLTWALDPKSSPSLPSSTRTVRSLTEVEAFALRADELKFVASQFRRLHSRQVQHTFRFYSQQWRTWAACLIQAGWRRYSRRKTTQQQQQQQPRQCLCWGGEGEGGREGGASWQEAEEGGASRFGATILASRFAANALRGIQRPRGSMGSLELMKLQKPSEPNFNMD